MTVTSLRSSQRGLGLLGLVFGGGLLACLFIVGAQIVPTVVEYQAIRKAAHKAANEASTVQEVRSVFERAAAIDNIESINGKDLDVSKEGDKIVVAFAYTREIHLAGPAYLLLKYQGRSK